MTLANRCFQVGCMEKITFGEHICPKCHWHLCPAGHCLCTLRTESAYVARVVEATTIEHLKTVTIEGEKDLSDDTKPQTREKNVSGS